MQHYISGKTAMLAMILLLLLAGAARTEAFSQQTVVGQYEVKGASADSLARYIRKYVSDKLYFAYGNADVAFYSARGADKEEFLESAIQEYRSKGYTIENWDGKIFVIRGKGFAFKLPEEYFAVKETGMKDTTLLKYASEETVTATFANKVYEIGDRTDSPAPKAYVKGYVRDALSGEPLAGVVISSGRTKTYTQTDANGFYNFRLSTGEDVLDFNAYSMESLSLNVKVWQDGSFDVNMKEKVFELKGAVVTADASVTHQTGRMGVERLRLDRIRKVPTAFGEADVLKVVLTLPGVKSVGEASGGFNVRGGSTDQNLVLFNDGTVYNPSHMFGVFSAFNPDLVSDIELYKSSIPVEYGGRISSVLDVKTREGNNKKFAGSLGIGVLTSRLQLEGPLKKDRTSFILGGRVTYSNWILNLLPDDSGYSGGKANFYDANLGITHHFNANNTIQFFGYYSADKFSFSQDTTFKYGNFNGSVKFRSHFNDRHSLTLTAGYDNYRNTLQNFENDYSSYTHKSAINQMYLKAVFKSVLSDRHSLTYGVNGIRYDMQPGKMQPYNESSLVIERQLEKENAIEAALFAGDEWKASDRLILEYGARLSGYKMNKDSKLSVFPEIRLSGKYSFADNFSVKAGFNTMNQYIHLLSNTTAISPMDTWKLSGKEIKPQNGWQAAAGLYWSVAGNLVDISLEGYYKQMNHYLDYKAGASLMMNEHLADDLIETRGKAYGVELMLKKTSGKLNGWLSYTYSRTLLKESQDRGIETINGGDWYNAPHDKPHDIKLVANYKLTHRFSFSANLDYSTGRPVTIPVGTYEYGGGTRLAYSERNAYRIPDYFRLDLAMNIEPGHYLKSLAHFSITFGVYNVTGRKNPYSVYFTSQAGQAPKGHMLSVFATQIPYANINIKF